MVESVAVVTLTRDRPDLLKRAIKSVQQQDFPGSIEHIVIVDECFATRDFLESTGNLPKNLVWHWVARKPCERSGPAREAKLRNYGVQVATARWVCFLDDDNEFEPNHIRSLVACTEQSRCRAVHSHMQIFWRDGTPYLESRMPWKRDPEESKRIYAKLRARGVFQPGSNIMRDRADPWDHPDPVRTVDTGEWLLERTLLLEYPFCEYYSDADLADMTTADDKLLRTLVKHKVRIACSELATLKYYLGGYSNRHTLSRCSN